MLQLIRTDASHPAFQKLVRALDASLAVSDGDDHAFYHQFNGIEDIHHVVLGYINEAAVACGAIKQYDKQTMEVKRMFVVPEHRGKAYAMTILKELEIWSRSMHFKQCILETGINQPAAIRLYKKADYDIIENYGQYEGVENSFCFKKKL